ncbi:response regulator [Noviherbaspirillum aerium]|uniref:response regulator n=1 Tax=Noviherbaspirillum aerium TaxID=2588497 RepID=UPI00124C30F1|nr:response regulator [Noviherbaspirillum aerium]
MSRPILLVEDAANDIEFALLALKRCGVSNEVIVAKDGEEALDYLLCRGNHQHRSTENPGLVLLDLKLPAIDGITVLRTIRATPTLASIPVVVLTASAIEADIHTTIALGIEEYVVKPMDIQHFIQTMCGIASRFIRH